MNLGNRRRLVAQATVMGVLFAAGVLAQQLSSPRVRAYNNSDNPGCSWPYSGGTSQLNIYFRDNPSYPPTSDYTGAYANASWAATSSPASFSYSGSGSSLRGVSYIGATGQLGVTYPLCSGGYLASASVYLNRTYLEPAAGTYATPFWRQYTAAHELGHNIGLGHSSYSSALMYFVIPGSPTFNSPQADDICGVNHLYASSSWPPACGY